MKLGSFKGIKGKGHPLLRNRNDLGSQMSLINNLARALMS